MQNTAAKGGRPESGGQAAVEFVIGLVAILALLGGVIQIGRLALAQTRCQAEARTAAGRLAISPSAPLTEPAAYLTDWMPGRDRRRHTRDDQRLVSSNAAALPRDLVGRARLDWAPGLPANPFSQLAASALPGAQFYLVKGQHSESVPVLPVFQRLVYAAPAIVVEGDAWLVWTEGLY